PTYLRKESKRKATMFSKRRKTFLRKADDLFRDCDAKIYTFIERKGRIWIYKSHPSDETLPRSKAFLLQQYPLPAIYAP
ncbi:hypothetical protein LZ30DRAFT_545667, partial [Colletotrichum cereale]